MHGDDGKRQKEPERAHVHSLAAAGSLRYDLVSSSRLFNRTGSLE